MKHHLIAHLFGAAAALIAGMATSKDPPPHVDMTLEEIRALIRESEWKFAKTMAATPHEYTLRKKAPDEPRWERFVLYIRQEGYRVKYGRTYYTYLDVDGWHYWTMGCPLGPGGFNEKGEHNADPWKHTILINRTRIPCTPERGCHHREGDASESKRHWNCPAHGPHTTFYCEDCKSAGTEQRRLW